jgi:arginine decarboxylase
MLIRVLVEICASIEKRLKPWRRGRANRLRGARQALMTDVPDLPNFSHFHDASVAMPGA